MKYFVLFIGIFCEKRDPTTVKCLTDSSLVDFSPTLKYITSELKSTCKEILENDGSLSSCSPSGDNLKCATTVAVGQACPPAPKDCVLEEDLVSTNQDCEYKCTQPELSCTTPGFLVDFEHSAADTIYCFNQKIDSCINKIDVDDDDRIVYKCPKDDCRYITGPEYTLVFDGTEFTNTHTGSNTDAFDCEESICNCDNSAKTLICDSTAYTDNCEDSKPNCQDGICYDAPPIYDYKFDITCDTSTNAKPEIEYCTNDVKVLFPCGESVKNDCKEEAGKINCYCDADATKCATIADAVWDADKCVIKDVQDEVEKMDCEFVCFDDNFQNEACKSGAAFDHEYWQCFDEFTKVEIVVPPQGAPDDEKSNLKAFIAPATTYDSFSVCTKPACPEGFCTCKDTERDGASAYCQSKGQFYVTEMELVEKNSRIDAAEYEFECLSFNEEYPAINIIGSESECRELKHTNPDIDAECPAQCQAVELTGTDLPHVGFSDCKCDKKCSYACASKYVAEFEDGTFPEGWNQETDDDVYTSYTCKKDNLVMIICTSIFVPLGVAGIAAGVYFFFFHESSEVAPVETDNELASTRSSEHNSTDEKKEETRSEITKDN